MTKPLWFSLVTPVVLLIVACGPAALIVTPTPAEQAAIYSAAVHHLFTQEPGALSAVAWRVIFVNPTLEGPDGPPTPPELLLALADLAPRVEFATRESAIASHALGPVRDGGIWLALGRLRPEGRDEVSLSVEHFVDGLHAAMYDLRLARQGDSWQVVEVKLRWVA